MIQRGKGVGCMWYPIGFTVAANPSAATVKVNEDGKVFGKEEEEVEMKHK